MKKNMYKVLIGFIITLIIIFNFNLAFAVDTSKFNGITKVTENDMGQFANFGGQIIYILQFLTFAFYTPSLPTH